MRHVTGTEAEPVMVTSIHVSSREQTSDNNKHVATPVTNNNRDHPGSVTWTESSTVRINLVAAAGVRCGDLRLMSAPAPVVTMWQV